MWSNQIKFDSRKYGEEAIVSESILTIHPLSSKKNFLSQPYKVSLTRLLLQDLIVNLDDITKFDDSSVFKLEKT